MTFIWRKEERTHGRYGIWQRLWSVEKEGHFIRREKCVWIRRGRKYGQLFWGSEQILWARKSSASWRDIVETEVNLGNILEKLKFSHACLDLHRKQWTIEDLEYGLTTSSRLCFRNVWMELRAKDLEMGKPTMRFWASSMAHYANDPYIHCFITIIESIKPVSMEALFHWWNWEDR